MEREPIETVIENQKEIREQLNRIEKMLRKQFMGTDELPFDYETTGYLTVSDMVRLGASTKFGKDGKEYVWVEKTDVPEVLKNAKDRGIEDQARSNLVYLCRKGIENARKFAPEEFRQSIIDKLSRKLGECNGAGEPVPADWPESPE